MEIIGYSGSKSDLELIAFGPYKDCSLNHCQSSSIFKGISVERTKGHWIQGGWRNGERSFYNAYEKKCSFGHIICMPLEIVYINGDYM